MSFFNLQSLFMLTLQFFRALGHKKALSWNTALSFLIVIFNGSLCFEICHLQRLKKKKEKTFLKEGYRLTGFQRLLFKDPAREWGEGSLWGEVTGRNTSLGTKSASMTERTSGSLWDPFLGEEESLLLP